jgi:hypothetical protein
MKVASLDRDEFVDWLGNQDQLPTERLTAKLLKNTASDRILIVWDGDDQTNATPIISVQRDAMRDFFAFVSTYIAAFKPFSAYFSVIPVESLERVVSRKSLGGVSRENFSRLVAVAFAEAYAQSRGKVRSLNDLTVQGVQATLSATLMTAIWKGFEPNELAQISQRWVESRRLISNGELAIPPNIVLEVWEDIGVSVCAKPAITRRHPRKKVASYLGEFFYGSQSFEDWFLPIAKEVLGNEEAVVTLKGSREERVKALPGILDFLFRSSNTDRSLLELVAGGLLSMVGNGSMSQLQLTAQLSKELPKAALWFGVFSAFQSRTDALTASNCLGRRVLRDLLRDVDAFSPPHYDISLDELSVIGEKALISEVVRTDHSGTIDVGLLGSVHAPFRRTPAKRENEELAQQSARIQFQNERIEELSFLLDRASRLLRDLHSPTQRDLFENEARRPRKPR